MFSGNRRFNGRQGEQILNEEQYTLYEILKHFLDTPSNPDPKVGPNSGLEKPGALWLDRQSSPGYGHLMYRDADKVWKPIFDDYFKLTKEIRNPNGEPENPLEGQLWINENGVLCWFNGSSFVPIKSQIADSVEFNANLFENFLIIDPLKMTGGYILENFSKLTSQAGGITEWKPNTTYKDGDLVFHNDEDGESRFYQYKLGEGKIRLSSDSFITEIDLGFLELVDLRAQYLIPSEVLDKVFINRFYAGDDVYEKKSDICIEIALSVYEGKAIAAVHVNPIALTNIRKRLIKVDKKNELSENFGCVRVENYNTEYYGLINGFGQLLIKGEDYMPYGGFIKLTKEAAELYDYVYAITYEFETKIKNKGALVKGTVKLSNQTSIWIGQIELDEELVVLAQGLALEDFYYKYDCDDPSGLVKFNGYDKNGSLTDDPELIETPLFESRTDVAIMRFNKVTPTSLFDINALEAYTENGAKKYRARISRPEGFIEPVVFVQGIKLDRIQVNETTIVVDDVMPGSSYIVADMSYKKESMFCYDGYIGADNSIPLKYDGFEKGTHKPMVFIEGFYISESDLDTSDGERIKINGAIAGQKYTVYKDIDDEDEKRLVFDGEVAFSTIPLKERIDDAVVYIANSLVIDGGAVFSIAANVTNAVDNEIKLVLDKGEEKWCIFNSDTQTWIPLSDDDEITFLDTTTSGYVVESKTINILQNFGQLDCTYYGYRFADNIEKPLLRGFAKKHRRLQINTVDINGEPITEDVLFYELERNHSYVSESNALNVWLRGIKQSFKEHSITDETGKIIQGFIVPYTDEPEEYLYVIENPESGEYTSCTRELLNNNDSMGAGTYNTSNVVLNPGVVTLYIDGYRQPQSAYVVNNMSTLTLVEPHMSNANMVTVIDENGDYKIVEAEEGSSLLVEVRRDYKLKEKTIELTEDFIEESMSQGIKFTSSMIFGKVKLPEDLFSARVSEIQIFINGAAIGHEFSKDDDAIILTSQNIKASNNLDTHMNDEEGIAYLKAGDRVTFEWR